MSGPENRGSSVAKLIDRFRYGQPSEKSLRRCLDATWTGLTFVLHDIFPDRVSPEKLAMQKRNRGAHVVACKENRK